MIKKITATFSIAFMLMIGLQLKAQIQMPAQWKFSAGDQAAWSSPDFDDSQWVDIDPLLNWESQMMPDYDGFGWYRVKVFIPSKYQEKAKKYGGLMLSLGKIDDVDMTWFNGSVIGASGSFAPDYATAWDQIRLYEVPLTEVLWDQYNSIAVRVFDSTGGGGLYGGPVELTLKGLSENILVNPVFEAVDQILKSGGNSTIRFELVSHLMFKIEGEVKAEIVSDFGQTLGTYTWPLKLKAQQKKSFTIKMNAFNPGFYHLDISVGNEEFAKKTRISFGYEPEKIVSPANPQADFDDYWVRAKKELAAVDPQFKMIRKDSLCTEKREVFLIEMRSLGNVLIRAWYSVPKAAGVYPAVMMVQGYSSTIMPEFVDYGDDIIGLGLNIRGHGNSQSNLKPGFPGYLQYQLHDKEMYIYRGAYMDCTRALDFLFTRPEVDKKRVGVEGGSQGGALTFATAALNNDRIAVCVPGVPFLSDFEDYFKLARWPANEFIEYVEEKHILSWEQVFYTLSYIDIKNLAARIKAPMLMGVGLKDDVCPPHINFAAYNQVTSPKRYIIYPGAGHGLPRDFDRAKMSFIRQHFGLAGIETMQDQ